MEITVLQLATKLYRDNIWKMHGLPRCITSNRGPQFAAELMKSLCTMLGTKQNLLTAYHPQTDGHVERSHQETEAFMRHYIDHLQDNWYDWLAIGEFQYNDKIHSSTNHTPFFLNYRCHPWKGKIQMSKGTNPTAEDFVHMLEIAQEEAAAAMAQAAEKVKSHYDLRR
jgi:transposase InsO family protein